MDKSYFIYTSKAQKLSISKFHICTWEFSDNSTLVEFGCEIKADSIVNKNSIDLIFFIPWLNESAEIEDFYSRLKESTNSRFIFNDSIIETKSLDDGQNINGVIHEFSERNRLCILPITFLSDFTNRKVTVRVDLNLYHEFAHPANEQKSNIYFRFCITPNNASILETKKGITKSSILYDIRANQRRNIPENLLKEILYNQLCPIEHCFCLNIIPNSHDLIFFDNTLLKNVRTLEYEAFNRYLGKKALREKDLIVVFNKDKSKDSYAFFSIFSKEHIGIDQLAVALLINLLAGILLFIAAINTSETQMTQKISIRNLPFSFWLVVILFVGMLLYFIKRRWNLSLKRKRK